MNLLLAKMDAAPRVFVSGKSIAKKWFIIGCSCLREFLITRGLTNDRQPCEMTASGSAQCCDPALHSMHDRSRVAANPSQRVFLSLMASQDAEV